MTTWTALTTLTGKSQAEALGEALEALNPEPTGVGVFEVEDGSGLWEVGGYFIQSPDQAGLALLAALHGAKDFTVSELPETDWVAHVKRELAPVEAGRFVVYGSHDADALPEGKIGLLIEAAMAFGTGHHGTTLGCLRALDALVDDGFEGQNVADIGCGTAVLAMAAAKIWPQTVLASDIDEVAVDVARANAVANDLDGRLICVEAAGFDAPQIAKRAPFDLVFANILKGPLLMLAQDMWGATSDGGYVILSGILNEQADEVCDHYCGFGYSLWRREEIGEWSTLVLRK
ncbi:50S ribosomal protein L11 methyltransferase [Nereida sp. MMG025]|uniref:50S ribosomal protein L11 methyltransferase n=1 Tax=Nereida sp. MMG025 TaxID=2909981 RepID=UPI001F420A68|nr:50S ribosomal protein L11 methyltransferase [Nereida sp. MMG025]MCF6444970.1 50S ribosomal protein L11 methyltransferase [Nereida sp. MMG025]